MIKASVLKNDIETNCGLFETQALAEAWVQSCEEKNKFGQPGDYSIVYTDVSSQLQQQQTNEQALKYLAETDWYIIRQQETGMSVPQDILNARAAARASIVR